MKKYNSDERVYQAKGISSSWQNFLENEGYKRVKKIDLGGNKQTYFVKRFENESERHMILIFQVKNFLKRFAQEIHTYRSARPDIVFNIGGKEYAIEVETGITLKKKRNALLEKILLLKKEFGNRWFFLVTDRNLKTRYEEYGTTLTKRGFKNAFIKFILQPEY